jgi:hypothetical protein
MAVMTTQQRALAFDAFVSELCTSREPIGVTKPDLRAALAGVDQWVSDNLAAMNAAIPLPARTQLTASQKARLLMAVVERRFIGGV